MEMSQRLESTETNDNWLSSWEPGWDEGKL